MPTEEELRQLAEQTAALNATIENLMAKYPSVRVRPWVNYSEDVYARVRVEATNVIIYVE